MNNQKKDAYDVAAKYLASRMKTRKETETQLQKCGFDRKDIDAALASLEDLGYLNDIEYTSVFISHGLRKGKTIWRIKKELEQKGVEKSSIESGILLYTEENQENPADNEFERGVAIVKKIIDSGGSIDKSVLAKAGRKLVSLGYKTDTVYNILGIFMKDTDN